MDSLSFISVELEILSSSRGAFCLYGSWSLLPPLVVPCFWWWRAVTFLLILLSSQCFHQCFLPQDQSLLIPLHCLSGTHAICEEVDFSLFPLLVHGLVLWRHPPEQWVCKGVSITISQLTWPDIHSPSLHWPPMFPVLPYSTAPPHCSSSAIPCLVDLTHDLTLFVTIVAYSVLKLYCWSLSGSCDFFPDACLELQFLSLLQFREAFSHLDGYKETVIGKIQ